MSPFVADLRFAQQTGKAVQVRLYSAARFPQYVGVLDVNENEGWVSFRTPQTFGDTSSRTRVELADVASVSVTDMDF